ncbi:MAG: histidine kinase [Saprospiraceae bacterium]
MRHLIFFALLLSARSLGAQVSWRDTSQHFSDIEWNNYSTSYLGEGRDSTPLLVTAIPNNGIYSIDDLDPEHSPLDMTFSGSAFRFRSNLEAGQLFLNTYDSSAVYFLAPGIFRRNAARYEFRVSEAGGKVVRDWSPIEQFTSEDFQLNQFREGFAFLGGYSAGWGHCLLVELREKGKAAPFTSSVVCWKETHPVLLSVLTRDELHESIRHLKNPFDFSLNPGEARKLAERYPAARTDSTSGQSSPPQLVLPAGEDELLVFLRAAVYKKEALEYRLTRDGRLEAPWQPNDMDNNFIWLRHLKPGDYTLDIRYAKQRHNPIVYRFRIEAPWYERWPFRAAFGLMALAAAAALVMLVQLRRQKRRMAAEQARQERLALGLRSVYAQLNPHFIFNALSSIQGLINRNDLDGANRYLSAFGSLVRSSLADVERNFIPLSREISALDTYLSLEKLRFGFRYAIETGEGLAPDNIEVPSLLLQPLAENAVKHGVSGLLEKGLIRVVVGANGGDLYIRVIDNGAGFAATPGAEGYGLKLTADRIKLLNEMPGQRRIVLHCSNLPGEGAQAEILFQNWLL